MNPRQLPTSLKKSSVAILLAAIGASPAHAVDSKIYPGAMCADIGNTGALVHDSGGIGNDSTTAAISVTCPIVHDSIVNSISSGWVQVVDKSSDQEFLCTLRRVSRSGSGTISASIGHQPTFGVGGNQLNFGSLSATGFSHYFYRCSIPPKTASGAVSLLLTYKVIENGGTE